MGLFSVYEPSSELLLPVDDSDKLTYTSIQFHSVNKRMIRNMLNSPRSEKNYHFILNTFPERDRYRNALRIHAHPIVAPINPVDIANLLILPEELGAMAYDGKVLYAAFVTEKTPLIEMTPYTRHLAHGRPVRPNGEVEELEEYLLKFCKEADSIMSSRSCNNWQWGVVNDFCADKNIELFVGKVSFHYMIHLVAARKSHFSFY